MAIAIVKVTTEQLLNALAIDADEVVYVAQDVEGDVLQDTVRIAVKVKWITGTAEHIDLEDVPMRVLSNVTE